MNKKRMDRRLGFGVISLLMSSYLQAATPLWTYSAPSPAIVEVSDGGTATVSYTVTNQSRRAKNLILKPTSGLSASPCYLPSKGSTCFITLSIDGNLIPPRAIHTGPILCEQGNPNQCYQPSSSNVLNVNKNTMNAASLQISVSDLVLSVTNLTEYGIPAVGLSTTSGRARNITVTNTGGAAATNVVYTLSSAWPNGTTISPASCGTIPPAGTCVLTIIPGATPSATVGEANPTPITISIEGSNTNTVSTTVQILTYGSVYQGGYVFAFDDTKGCVSPTTCAGSVEGKVMTIGDISPGVAWSIYPDNPSGVGPLAQSSLNGGENTQAIVAKFPNDGNNYAANLCSKLTELAYEDWYLPAVCEMGYDAINQGSGCGTGVAPTLQNIQSNLVAPLVANAPNGLYWSSTETASAPAQDAWYQYFTSTVNGHADDGPKDNTNFKVRCIRGFK